jgi:hypothetical protein
VWKDAQVKRFRATPDGLYTGRISQQPVGCQINEVDIPMTKDGAREGLPAIRRFGHRQPMRTAEKLRGCSGGAGREE